MNPTSSPMQNTSGPAPMHRSRAEIEAGFALLPPQPRDNGRVALIVRRGEPGERESLASTELSPTRGVPGDAWETYPGRRPENQITVIRRDVAELLCNGQSLAVPGDNLVVDLDLSAENLPAGSRLKVGDALLEVTPEPHDGCATFQKRLGADALRFVAAKATRHLNLRGIHFRVIEAGTVEVGSPIVVLSRPPVL